MGPGQKTVVVGAGPVGALAALYAAIRGDDVEIYDLRGDLRDPSTVPLNFTRSINLALSERGINAMRHADRPALLEAVLGDTIPMHGRMVHGQRLGQPFEQSQKYDVHGRFIRAVDRAGLNKRLLDELERMPNVKFFFNHKLTGADFRKRTAWFERRDVPRGADNRGLEIEVPFDFMIGSDGAHSAVRFHLMKFSRVSYQQEYVETLWCEFHIAAGDRGSYKISPNHLHIWPAGEFMFIALPSTDGSFTCTLFLSEEGFKRLDKAPDTLIDFFKSNFPGVVDDLIPADELKHQYATNPHLPLISIKCAPYHYNSSVVILGDAAHAMVPFYGQGMNAGLEDVRVLYEFLDEHLAKASTKDEIALARGQALEAYTDYRAPDAAAINDLAMGNYGEMRSDVRSPTYKLRKWIEEWLYNNFPQLGWATQYSRVSFGNERYSEVERASERQTRILLNVIYGSLAMGVGLSLWSLRKWHHRGGSLPLISRIFRR